MCVEANMISREKTSTLLRCAVENTQCTIFCKLQMLAAGLFWRPMYFWPVLQCSRQVFSILNETFAQKSNKQKILTKLNQTKPKQIKTKQNVYFEHSNWASAGSFTLKCIISSWCVEAAPLSLKKNVHDIMVTRAMTWWWWWWQWWCWHDTENNDDDTEDDDDVACAHASVSPSECVCVCVCVRAQVSMHLFAYVYASVYTYMRSHTCTRTQKHAHMPRLPLNFGQQRAVISLTVISWPDPSQDGVVLTVFSVFWVTEKCVLRHRRCVNGNCGRAIQALRGKDSPFRQQWRRVQEEKYCRAERMTRMTTASARALFSSSSE